VNPLKFLIPYGRDRQIFLRLWLFVLGGGSSSPNSHSSRLRVKGETVKDDVVLPTKEKRTCVQQTCRRLHDLGAKLAARQNNSTPSALDER
jgi:hypothetical protein